jgi:hypothetical protein
MHTAPHADSTAVDLTAVPSADRDRVWLETVYRGDDTPQATLRAILMGGIIGGSPSCGSAWPAPR